MSIRILTKWPDGRFKDVTDYEDEEDFIVKTLQAHPRHDLDHDNLTFEEAVKFTEECYAIVLESVRDGSAFDWEMLKAAGGLI